MRFLRNAKGKKVAMILARAEFKRLSEASEEMACIGAHDAAKASGETPIPYEQVLKKIEHLRK